MITYFLKELVYWMQNTWRKPKPAEDQLKKMRLNKSETVWQTRKDEVLAEIAKMLGLESVDTNTAGWFEKRMEAIKNIRARMSEEEKQELEREQIRLSTEGFSEEVKQQYVS